MLFVDANNSSDTCLAAQVMQEGQAGQAEALYKKEYRLLKGCAT